MFRNVQKISQAFIILSTVLIFFTMEAPIHIKLLFVFMILLGFANQITKQASKEEIEEAKREAVEKWEAENIKLSEFEKITDEQQKNEYLDKSKNLFYDWQKRIREKVDNRRISFYIQLPKNMEIGIVDEIFGIIFGIFITNTLLSLNEPILIDILLLSLVSLIVSAVALGAMAKKGRIFLFGIAILLTIALSESLRFLQSESYNENNIEFLVYAVWFWFTTKELTVYLKNKISL